jgi:hypothetical protein
MAKFNFSNSKVLMKDWMAMKPYPNPSQYDQFYLKLCNDVFDIIDNDGWFEDQDIEREDVVKLACVIVSYYEDFINEIGIWSAFVNHNKESFGYYLPFYDLSDYDPDYINLQDIMYLFWHFTSIFNEEKIYSPDHDYFIDWAEEIFDLFEEKMEESPAINYYEKKLTISKGYDYFSLKETLNWFGMKSYLLTIESNEQYHEEMDEIKEMVKQNKDYLQYVNQLEYATREMLIFTKRYRFAALTAPEWLALVVDCTPEKREEIKELSFKHKGTFLYEGEYDNRLYQFKNVVTNQQYLVKKDSFQNSKIGIPKGYLCSFDLIKWDGDWMMSGVMIANPYEQKVVDKAKFKPLHEKWMLSEETLKASYETTDLMYQAFISYFGGPLTIMKSVKEAEEKMEGFNRHYAIEFSGISKEEYESRPKLDPKVYGFKEMFSEVKDVTMFFHEGVGQLFQDDVSKLIEMLNAKELDMKTSGKLFSEVIRYYNHALLRYLFSKYPMKNIKFPVNTRVDVIPFLEYFWRYKSPEEFDKEYPMMMMVDGEEFKKAQAELGDMDWKGTV